jgi:lipopolysaccharide/colanic/teichoic acid biosynthesis glycosyltransferase
MKRLIDISVAAVGLLLLAPLFGVVALMIKLDSRGRVFFRQKRIGKGFRPFWIYKFRTMTEGTPVAALPLTVGEDPRITRVGRFLRRSKIDELPQLINILKGEMTLVGPRPEVPRYVEAFRHEYQEILTMRPGLTDLASLKYRDESELLGQSDHPEEEYLRCVLPDKIRLGKEYIRRSSLLFDFSLIVRTLLKVIFPRSAT